MSDIDSVPTALVHVEASNEKATEQYSHLSSVKDELSELVGRAVQIQEYFEGLAAQMNEHGKPSLDEAVAAEQAEDLSQEISDATANLEEVMTRLEGIREKYDTLAAQCNNVMTR